ncbi:MAG TPA: hypothetical protein VGN86_12490 [Pyrinomonadaceae bacterium]|jgi:hypothetical protein|nr:hypothetical protein [Pyrinomonadaceae bacterium]
MTLRTSLLRQLDNPDLSVDSRAELRCEIAREFENKGEYEEARAALGELWKRVGAASTGDRLAVERGR